MAGHVAVLAALSHAGIASAATEEATFSITSATRARAMTAGSDGNMWFCRRQAAKGEVAATRSLTLRRASH
jgi:hypothetical protein